MKSILVIDTPESCEECELRRNSDSQSCPLKPILWCPLKPLPQKKEVEVNKIEDIMHTELQLADIFSNKIMAEVKFETDKLIALGWNACLDAIIGETE